jgi:hypothetical protein
MKRSGIDRRIVRLQERCRHPVKALLHTSILCKKHHVTTCWSLCRNCKSIFPAKKKHRLFSRDICYCKTPIAEDFILKRSLYA